MPAAAAALLVVGVLATRDGTAAAGQDFLPVGGPEPSGTPSVALVQDQQVEDGPVVLQANGLPGARLGSSGGRLQTSQVYAADGRAVTAARLPGGCVPAWSNYADGTLEEYDMSLWLVDDLVSAVVLTRWDPTTAVVSGLQTWLGPTLGSPVADASALPGARTTTERPFGATGPAVTVVHVGGDGVDVVFSDVVHDLQARTDAAPGRITTVEVRHPRARGCSTEAVAGARPGADGRLPATDLALGPDGVTVLPVGTLESGVLARPGAQQVFAGPGDVAPGCRSYAFASASGGEVRVVTLDGVVVQGEAVGPVPSELGVADGDSPGDVLRAFPQLAERADGGAVGGTGEVVVGDRVVRIEMGQAERWVPEVDVPVRGGPPGVRAVSVRDAAVPPTRLC